MLSFGLHKLVNSHLRAHLSRKAVNKENFAYESLSTSNADQSLLIDERFDEQEKPSTQSVVAERIVRRKSLLMRNKQQDWKVSVIHIWMTNDHSSYIFLLDICLSLF